VCGNSIQTVSEECDDGEQKTYIVQVPNFILLQIFLFRIFTFFFFLCACLKEMPSQVLVDMMTVAHQRARK
jgi:hypothetical protein